MVVSQSIFEQHDIFKTMHPLKVQVMKELVENMRGKSMKEAAPLLMAAMNKLKANKLSFTMEENKILMGILTKDMSEQDKAKVEMMKEAMNKRKK